MKSVLITLAQLGFALLMYVLVTLYFGVALAPGIALCIKSWRATVLLSPIARYLVLGVSIAGSYFLFGLGLILLVGLTRLVLRLRLPEGHFPIFSGPALKWAFVSCLYMMVLFTFIDFILLTPFANLLLRLLGARLGKNVQVNSKFVFDATLIEVGDNTVIGGGAIVIGHIVEHGMLRLKKVKIGKNVTVGSHATIMPGCEIGDGAMIGAGAVLRKNTRVEPRSIYFGMPAERVGGHRPKPQEVPNVQSEPGAGPVPE